MGTKAITSRILKGIKAISYQVLRCISSQMIKETKAITFQILRAIKGAEVFYLLHASNSASYDRSSFLEST